MSTTPTTQTVYQNSIQPELQPYATQILNTAQGVYSAQGATDPTTGLPAGLVGQMGQVAGFSPLQTQAMGNIQQMQVAPQTGQATGMSGMAGLAALNTPQYTGANVQQYMNPYLQTTQNAAISNYANSLPSLGSAASQVGGLGGSREALMQAQAQQGLQQTLAGNVNNAFQNAQNQFNTSVNQQQAGQNTAINAANTLGNLGMQNFQQQAGINTALLGAGQLQQQQQQNIYNTGVANAQLQANYPWQQSQNYMNLVRGTPTATTGVANSAATPSLGANLANLGLGSLFGVGG
jgi:hypothetical protein